MGERNNDEPSSPPTYFRIPAGGRPGSTQWRSSTPPSIRQPQIAADPLELRRQRSLPRASVDCDTALRDLPCVADARIETGFILVAVASRPGDCAELARRRCADRQADRPDAADLELEVFRRRGSACRERP